MSTLNKQSLGQVLLSAVLVLAVTQGCGKDDDNPTPPDVNAGGSNSTGGSTTKAGSSGKAGGGTAGETGTPDGGGPEGGTAATVGGGNEGGSNEPPLPTCDLPERGANDCFNCPQDGELSQWLNRCVDGECEPFDNKTRVPLLKADGSLPDLPN
jgi:hypothetical protein